MSEEKTKEAKTSPADKIAIQKDKWKWEITEKLRIVEDGSEDLCIFKVPSKLRRGKDDAYSPRVASIGPFHRENQELAALREHKWCYMLHFFQQVDPQQYQNCWEKCINTIYGLDAKVRASYAEKIKCSMDELAEIMLVDGCFILELFLRYDQQHAIKSKHQRDAIYNNAWMIPDLRHDLALLENQIPFFILKMLYDTVMPHVPEYETAKPISSLALSFFQLEEKPILNTDCKHLLHLLHKFYLPLSSDSTLPNHISIPVSRELNNPENQVKQPTSHPPKQDPASNEKWGFNLSASQLLDAGIDFQKGTDEDHLLEITFVNGVIRIPKLLIEETTFSLFRNLIAFEQCSLSSRHHITSYAILLRSLIRSPADINILKKREIIYLKWVEYKECLAQFKSIKDQVVVKDFSFIKVCNEVNAYRNKGLHWKKYKVSWSTKFQKNIKFIETKYFKTPWSIISFIAAVVLFILTGIQTYYTVRPR